MLIHKRSREKWAAFGFVCFVTAFFALFWTATGPAVLFAGALLMVLLPFAAASFHAYQLFVNDRKTMEARFEKFRSDLAGAEDVTSIRPLAEDYCKVLLDDAQLRLYLFYPVFQTRDLIERQLRSARLDWENGPAVVSFHEVTGKAADRLVIPFPPDGEKLGAAVTPPCRSTRLYFYRRTWLRRTADLIYLKLNELQTLQKEKKQLTKELKASFGQDLHDSTAQQLFFLSAQTYQLKRLLNCDPVQFREQLNKLEESIQDFQVNTRSYIAYLKADDANLSLFQAIEQMIKRLSAGFNIKARLHADGMIISETVKVEESIYRVIEELTSNAIKHGNISRIDVYMHINPIEWQIVLTDDGDGTFPELDTDTEQLGMQSIQSRLEQIKGSISFSERKEQGLKTTITIPRGEVTPYDERISG
ncbi:sensor histidine kinase [Salisediminibacterium halotolerans]|nr:histidine kinase [Salisediminibacterium halotolerans]